ncbi:MAG: tRNA (adenosine(37)-N6)-threonylcarbamoyltransferase complex dimerization subunit type 1 TsaB [Candidatus Omnitrophica bacterium]|nr:tRNA (adenosine(37)-N6)-threonylcarbamoyltransferase complex dimerization subunit type 1 TsaB [Candidatus Omnitrophota bacterium]
MKLLLVDTSTENLSFAFSEGDRPAVTYNRIAARSASALIAELDSVCRNSGIRLEELDALAVGGGPGSFTGLRISFAAVKGLSIALNVPVMRIGSFFSCAYPFRQHEKIAVVADARRELWYGATFRGGAAKALSGEKTATLVRPKDFVPAHREYLFLTPDVSVREELNTRFPEVHRIETLVFPRAQYFLPSAAESFRRRQFVPLKELEPWYLHPDTCQIRRSAA